MSASKLLVFAHVPPPHHGQSYMVKLMLEGLEQQSPGRKVYHVDARVSDDLADVGGVRLQKILRLLKCIVHAWWIRLRHGPMAFYYVPAPAKRSAILRDWLVMTLCRPFFSELILHWHAYGLGEWVACGSNWQQKFTRWALRGAVLSIVLNNYNKRDAEVFVPKRIEVVPNGVEDYFPDYHISLQLHRSHRSEQLHKLDNACQGDDTPKQVCFLFLGHLIASKGVFVAIEATRKVNEALRRRCAAWRAKLMLAGSFASAKEREDVLAAIAEETGAAENEMPQVELLGFLGSEEKKAVLKEADFLLFPTFYEGETQGLVLLEAMSAGLSVITTSWRGVAEVLPEGYNLVVAPKSVEDLVSAMFSAPRCDWSDALRQKYEENFTLEIFQKRIVEVLR